MPGYRTHIRAAWCIYILIVVLSAFYTAPHNLHLVALGLLGITIGTLFPDIDITSMGQKTFFTIAAALIVISMLCKAPLIGATIGLVCCIPVLSTHRGPFHHPLVITILVATSLYAAIRTAPKYLVWWLVGGISFWLGAMIHLILDKHVRPKKRWRLF